jgi:conjugative transfer signal peptidase TraF
MLLWNASASSPTGLYLVTEGQEVRLGEHVVAWAPDWARLLAAERHYLPLNVPLVKRVAAGAGDQICATNDVVTINGKDPSRRRSVDGAGRPMPMWEGCWKLGKQEYFLFDPNVADGFDGRYFGLTTGDRLVGKARLIWPS